MKKFILFYLILTLGFSFKVHANTLLNLICDQEEFHSKNHYLSKSLGHSFSNGRKFFQLEFNNNYQKLETDMLMVVDNRVANFENNNDILKVITVIDHLNWGHIFEINRYTGKLEHIRYFVNDNDRTEVFIYICESKQRKF